MKYIKWIALLVIISLAVYAGDVGMINGGIIANGISFLGDGDDTYGSAASFIYVEIKYTKNKLGE